jgi:hypothetical protein
LPVPVLYWPLGQAVQALEGSVEKRPAAQGVQTELIRTEPGVHTIGEQELEPGLRVVVPVGQAWQLFLVLVFGAY